MNSIPNQPSELKWHVLLVKPRSEKKVGQRLTELGFDACVPTQKQWKKWSDRKKQVEVVLFNNYVFVAADEKRRNQVFLAGNVFKYLSFGGCMATLTAKEVAIIKSLSGLEAKVEITYEGLRVGDEVEIHSGRLAGFCGKIIGMSGSSRLQLELPSLHCFAQVEVRGLEVRRASNQLS